MHSLVLNPKAKNYALLKRTWEEDYEDNHWAEDSIFLERNSRDFVSRIDRIGTNAEAICDVLSAHPRGSFFLFHILSFFLPPSCSSNSCNSNQHPLTHPTVKQVNYPRTSPTRPFYDACRTPTGGYGGLLSATFHTRADAIAFFDALDTVKGPSLGTNFTLSSPYVILAHYGELDWCKKWGVEADLIRFSVGLEETGKLVQTFRRALDALPEEE
jgi:cystathionine gamma-synthase